MFPVANSTSSYWLSEPHRLANYRSSESPPAEIDIAIIGTGLAGVSTAYHILKSCQQTSDPVPSVVLFEARQACSGATGRNGGHVKCGGPSIKGWREKYSQEAADELIEWVWAQQREMKTTADTEDIDCDLLVTRSYDVYFDATQAAELKTWLFEQQQRKAAWTAEVQWLEGPNLERITGIKGAAGAISVPAISLWPYKFVTSLLSRVLEMGATLHTETPVKHVDDSNPEHVKLSTEKGVTMAKKVIYATNGYSAALLPQFRNVIVPIRGQAARLVPNQDTHHGFHPTTTYNLFHTSKNVDYLNPRPDGTIVLGGGARNYRTSSTDRNGNWFNTVNDAELIDAGVRSDFDTTMEKNFRGWEKSEAKVAMTWTGIMGVTGDAFPHVGRVPGTLNQWILAGFNGGGMALIFTMTKEIAKMVLRGVDFEKTKMPSLFKTSEERVANGHLV